MRPRSFVTPRSDEKQKSRMPLSVTAHWWHRAALKSTRAHPAKQISCRRSSLTCQTEDFTLNLQIVPSVTLGGRRIRDYKAWMSKTEECVCLSRSVFRYEGRPKRLPIGRSQDAYGRALQIYLKEYLEGPNPRCPAVRNDIREASSRARYLRRRPRECSIALQRADDDVLQR